MMRPNWQKDCANHEMILKVIMMCASSKIICKRLEAVVEAIRGQIENKEVSSNFEHHKNFFQKDKFLSDIS